MTGCWSSAVPALSAGTPSPRSPRGAAQGAPAAALAARGVKVLVPTRRRERAKHLILLPTVDVVEADVFAPGVLERLATGRQAVINVVGILHGRRGRRDERGPNDYGPDFARVHVELPQAILAACRATGARR